MKKTLILLMLIFSIFIVSSLNFCNYERPRYTFLSITSREDCLRGDLSWDCLYDDHSFVLRVSTLCNITFNGSKDVYFHNRRELEDINETLISDDNETINVSAWIIPYYHYLRLESTRSEGCKIKCLDEENQSFENKSCLKECNSVPLYKINLSEDPREIYDCWNGCLDNDTCYHENEINGDKFCYKFESYSLRSDEYSFKQRGDIDAYCRDNSWCKTGVCFKDKCVVKKPNAVSRLVNFLVNFRREVLNFFF